MTTYIPITLEGNTLGERQRHLNTLVNDAYQRKIPFDSIQHVPEFSAVDHLFKIDLASKLRHLEYILANLKDNDMLYVSRALQSTWLLEPQYCAVINPSHLEDVLFPEMTTTAVNKMINWLHVHLKDSGRCLEFFQYYCPKNLDIAVKFLWNCPEEVICDMVEKILKNITPKRLKLLCEKCPRAVRIFYELIPKNKDNFRWNESNYYRALTNLINTDSNLLLDIAEKYFSSNCCSSFSSRITQAIMNKHKDRYVKKPELYAAWLLHLPTLAKCLNDEEIKDIVLRLAKAEYLGANYFSYKRVEPLIKQLSENERAAFKKLIFIDKCIGDKVKDWPYEPPSSPTWQYNDEPNIFIDKKFEPADRVGYGLMQKCCFRSMRKINKRALWRPETLLDKLFNKYRCISFKKTFIELSKQIPAESSVQTREYMMLVLVSKAGGHVDNLKDLLELLVSRHNNEAENFRATIVRSLVKRAKVWQLPNDLWQMFLKFAHGLGLDGEKSDENCFEGLHAVVLRNILLVEECSPKVFTAFIGQFSTFSEYTLNDNEKRKVLDKLPFMLLASANEQTKTSDAIIRLEAVMKLLNDYKLTINQCPGLVPAISKLAQQDPEPCLELLRQLYNSRIARKEFFRENFTFLQSNESYLNILRHDTHMLIHTDKFRKLASENIDHDNFLRKLAIYFSECEGLAANYLHQIEKEMTKDPRGDLCRSFAILAGPALFKQLQEVDSVTEKSIEQKRLAVHLRAYGHLSRPKLDLVALGFRKAGVKAVANQISVCCTSKVEEHMIVLLDWPRASRLACLLAKRIDRESEILPVIALARPAVAIKITLRHLKQRGEGFDSKVWGIGKEVLEKIDLSQPKHIHLRERLAELDKAPESLRADYGAVLYRAFRKELQEEAMKILLDMEDYLQKADEAFVVEVIKEFLDNEVTFQTAQVFKYPCNMYSYLIIRMIANYLLFCENEETQKRRMETIGKPFLSHMKTVFDKSNKGSKKEFLNYWNSFMYALKCTNVFMDTSYVSCLPVMQLVVDWLKDTMSIVEHFEVYATMHLNMLYYKAIRQSIKQNPQIFSDKVKRNEVGVEIVGVIFGKYIAHEIIQLKTEYFESIVEIYAKVVTEYFEAVFNYNNSFWKFVSALISGMLEEKDSSSLLLAEKLYVEYRHSLKSLKDDKTFGVLEGIEDKQLKFFMNADMGETFVECY